jgi:hypothetical protein
MFLLAFDSLAIYMTISINKMPNHNELFILKGSNIDQGLGIFWFQLELARWFLGMGLWQMAPYIITIYLVNEMGLKITCSK